MAELRRLLYFAALIFFLTLSILHIFGIIVLPGDKMTFFLLGLVFILFLLPAVSAIHFFDLVKVNPKTILKKKN